MKRSYSLYTVVGGLLLSAFLLLSASLLAFNYHNARKTIEREIDLNFSQNQALLESVFDAYLRELSLRLSNVAHQVTGRSLEEFQQSLPLRADSSFDLLLIASTHGRPCINLSPDWVRLKLSCRQVIEQFDDELYPWHLLIHQDSTKLSGMITREPLIDPVSGYIHGYLYGGVLFQNSLALVNKARSAAPNQLLAVGIALDKQLLIGTPAPNSTEQQALAAILDQPMPISYGEDRYFGRSSYIPLNHEGKGRLQFLTITGTDALSQLEKNLVSNSLMALIVSTLLAAGLAMAALRIALSPLKGLLHFARQERDQQGTPLVRGRIREFNQLSQSIAQIVTQLDREKQRSDQINTHLEARSAQLSQANDELQRAIVQNKALLHQIMNLQEEERKHLAQELHDDLGQTLTVVSTDAYLIRSQVPEGSPAYISAQSIYRNAQEMYDIVYNRIVSLRPLPLNDLGLAEAIRYMPALKSFDQQGIEVDLELNAGDKPLAETIEINIFRIVQEGLTNILKHSQADKAWVKLDHQADRLLLEVGDNGVGFDVADPALWERFGLSGMQERAQSIGGILGVSRVSNGICLQVEVPLLGSHGQVVEKGRLPCSTQAKDTL